MPHTRGAHGDRGCLTDFERMTRGRGKACLFMEGKIGMAARRQVTNKLRDAYRKGSRLIGAGSWSGSWRRRGWAGRRLGAC